MKKPFFLLILCYLFITYSCKKIQVDNETTSCTDYAQVSQEFMQIFLHVNGHASAEKGLYKLGNPGNLPFSVCPDDSLTGDTVNNAQGVFTDTLKLPVMWLQYHNCTGTDGKTRNGTIKVSFTKKYTVTGCVATVSLINYSVNGLSCTGTLSIIRNAANTFTYNISNGTLGNGTSWNIKYNCSAIVTWFDNGTPGITSDDYIQALGNAGGTNRENRNYDVTINDPVKKRADCAWISQGKVSLTPAGLHTRTVDFGNGNCDDIASFVLDSQTFSIHMSK
jgi:hypothetical protein